MRAIQATAFGDPSVLTLVDIAEPTPGPGQVTIDVTHAAVGLIDVLFRQGAFRGRPGLPEPPFVPGLEVAGRVRALGPDVDSLRVGERVVSFSSTGTGGYAAVAVRDAKLVVSLEARTIDSVTAVAVVPNAAMAFLALARVGRLRPGESVLVHGALGGFASAVPGMARHLGAKRVVGTVRATKLDAAAKTRLPYDAVVSSDSLGRELGDEKFDVIVDPVGGPLRTRSLDLLRPFGRLIVVGNASGDWSHALESNRIWLGSASVLGFNAGSYFPAHPEEIRPAVDAALDVVEAGGCETVVDVLPLAEAEKAHARMERRALDGRIVLGL